MQPPKRPNRRAPEPHHQHHGDRHLLQAHEDHHLPVHGARHLQQDQEDREAHHLHAHGDRHHARVVHASHAALRRRLGPAKLPSPTGLHPVAPARPLP